MKQTIQYKLLYILLFFEIGLFLTYFPKYLSDSHLTKIQIGRILSVQLLAAIFIQPLLKMIANKYNCYNTIIKTAIIFAIVSLLNFQYADKYILILIITIIFQMSHVNIIPAVDAHCISFSNKENIKFGSIRLYGSAGYIIGSFLGGFIYKKFTFLGNTLISSLLLLLFLLIFIWINPEVSKKNEHKSNKSLFRNIPFILFIVVYGLLWSANAITDQYMIFLLKNFNKTEVTLGILLSIGVIVELITMFILAKLSFNREILLLIIGSLLLFLRTGIYTFVNNYYYIIFATVFAKGLSIAFILSYSLSFISKLVPKKNISNAVVLNLMATSIIQLISIQLVSYIYTVSIINNVYLLLSIQIILAIFILLIINQIIKVKKYL